LTLAYTPALLVQGKDKAGRAILVLRPGELNFKACTLRDYQKMGVFLVENAIQKQEVQESGMVMLIDLTGASFSTLSHLTIADAQRWEIYLLSEPIAMVMCT